VVNGLITNKTEAYQILLSSANAFNSYSAPEPVIAANVYVTDDYGNSYIFQEIENGNYISDSSQFTGQPGGIYNLHITTLDGQEYESEPQRLFPETYLDSVYAEFDFKEILDISTGLKKNIHGAYIFCDIPNHADTLPRLRLVSNLVTQYFYTICPRGQPCKYYY